MVDADSDTSIIAIWRIGPIYVGDEFRLASGEVRHVGMERESGTIHMDRKKKGFS